MKASSPICLIHSFAALRPSPSRPGSPCGIVLRLFCAIVAVFFVPLLPAGAAFTLGNLVVERIGDGGISLSGAATQISVLEVSPGGAVVQTISFDTSGSNQQTDAGSAQSNGYLNAYTSGTNTYVSVPGHDAVSGSAGIATTNTKANSILDGSGSVVSRTLFPTGGPSATPRSPFSGSNFRSSIATSGSTFYAAGNSTGSPNTGGMWYFNGTSFTQISGTASSVGVTNIRNAEIYNGQLYHSSASGSFLGISALGTGLPTTSGQLPSLAIDMGAGASPYGFVMFDTNNDSTLDLAYIADDRSAAGGGLQKWTFDGSAWSSVWSVLVSGTSDVLQTGTGTGFAGLRGLAGSWSAVSGATLYATTAAGTQNNSLISILDSGTSAPGSYTTLLRSGSNQVFRGVDVLSVPEPSCAVLLCGMMTMALLRRSRRC